MPDFQNKLKLVKNRWFAWQMIPGYFGERSIPYCSPIYMKEVIPRKTGRNIITLKFDNVFYAEGVQDFEIDFRVIKHAKDYMIGEFSPDERSAVISHIEFGWIEQFCPRLWYFRPPSTVSDLANGSVSIWMKFLEIVRAVNL